jgi:hypothetical protein
VFRSVPSSPSTLKATVEVEAYASRVFAIPR